MSAPAQGPSLHEAAWVKSTVGVLTIALAAGALAPEGWRRAASVGGVLAAGALLHQAHARAGRTRLGLQVLGALLAVLGLAAALVPQRASTTGAGPVSAPSPGSSPLPVPSSTPPVTRPPGDPGPRAPVAGYCLPRAADRVLDCRTAHTYEVVHLGACDAARVVRYLGGDPAVDVLLTAPRAVQLLGTQSCVVNDPRAEPSFGSARGALQGEFGAAWRRCLDMRTGDDSIACSEPHSGEYVLRSPPAPPIACDEAARRYLGAPMSNFIGQLEVRRTESASGIACVVAVRGADRLGDSLRNLGTSALPLVGG